MSTDDDHEEQLASRLIAYDEALATGCVPAPPDTPLVPLELHGRLDRDLDCVRLLHELRPRRPRCDGSLTTSVEGLGEEPASSSALLETPLMSQAGHLLGRFELRRELGRGGFGVVFLAYDPVLGREVALKVPRLEALVAPELRQRFQQEARAAAGLDHPNIVPVYEAGEIGPICYIASAYCPGATLAEWLKERPDPVPFDTAAELVADLADAVRHAHSRGVVHRDLKPSNVMVGSQPSAIGNQPESAPASVVPIADSRQQIAVKITDFGLAKLMDTDAAGPRTQTGAVLGTPSYMAPEQAGAEKNAHDPSVDIYALGAILYEVLTGRPPFLGDSDVDTLVQVRTLEPIAPRRLRPTLPRDLETICLKCLQKEPRRRYASAGELAEDLRRFLRKEPIRARPVGLLGRSWRWCRRRPAVASLVAVLVLVVIGSVFGLAALVLLAEERARLAEQRRDESDQSLRRGLRAIDQYFTKISEEELLNVEGMQPLRQKLLGEAVKFYQEFLEQRKDDPRLREEVALAHHRLAKIKGDMGRAADSQQDLLQAIEGLKRLVEEQPKNQTYVNELAKSYQDLGTMQSKVGRNQEALASYREAQRLLEESAPAGMSDRQVQSLLAQAHQSVGIVQCGMGQVETGLKTLERSRQLYEEVCQHQADDQTWLRLALTHQFLGGVLCNLNRLDESAPHLHRALEIQERFVAHKNGNHDAKRNLGKTLTALGRVENKRRNLDTAVAYHERALAVSRRLARENPQVLDHQILLAEGLNLLGIVHNEAGRRVEAHGCFRQSIDLLRDLVQENPDNAVVQISLGQTWHNLGDVLDKLKRPEDALRAYAEAVEHGRITLTATPENSAKRWSLAKHYREISSIQRSLGRHAEAAAAARERAKLYPSDARQLGETCVAFMQCMQVVEDEAQRRKYGDEAMDYLRRAVACGYKNVKQLKESSLFDPLRGRGDFQKLLADLQK